MAQAYPQFRSFYSHEEMVEHFLLTPAELQLVLTCRGDTNRCGMALLLKTLSHLGYVPDPMPHVPEEVRSFVAGQIGLLWDCSDGYAWSGSTHNYHLAQIRQHTGWRFPTARDKDELESWLRTQGAMDAHTADALFAVACERLRQQQVDTALPGSPPGRLLVQGCRQGDGTYTGEPVADQGGAPHSHHPPILVRVEGSLGARPRVSVR